MCADQLANGMRFQVARHPYKIENNASLMGTTEQELLRRLRYPKSLEHLAHPKNLSGANRKKKSNITFKKTKYNT